MDISRRHFLMTALLTGAARPLGAATGIWRHGQPAAAQPASPPATVFTSLRGGVGIFTGQGGTIGWLVSPDGVIVVDTQMGPTAKTCFDGINERSGKRPIDCVFNTHHHYDHTGGNGIFKPAARRVVAHENVPALQKAGARPGTEAEQVYADTPFTDRFSATIGKEKVSAVHYGPAHTAGDGIITFEQANVVHVGDLVFNRRLPVLDRPGGCRIVGWIAVLERAVKDHPADALYVFGHAKPGLQPTGTKDDVLYQRDFLSALLDYTKGEIKAGKTRDQIVKAAPELKGFPDHGPLTERVLAAAYEELTSA